MKYLANITLIGLLLVMSACSLTDLDANLENPNNVGVDELDVNLLMNQVQAEFAEFFAEVDEPAMELSRMVAMTGGDVYERAYQAQSFNASWTSAYQQTLVQIETLLSQTDGTGLTVHSGSARVLKAYVYLTLADMFGDVPFSEATRGSEGIFNPKTDDDAAVYEEVLKLLDEAIALLGQTATAGLSRDIFYGGSAAKWTALANTLKFKAYLNLRLTNPTRAKTEIEKLLVLDLIDTDAEEFTYKYSAADVPQRSRHPWYREMYRPQVGAAGSYINNYYMQCAYNQKGVEDPRWRYYFYRQVGSLNKALQDDPESIPCIVSPRPDHYPLDVAFCAFDPGFFGRDHGNNDGLPPDSRAKTVFGVYPAGGLSDKNFGDASFQVVTRQGQGANGAGIQPIWMASFTSFLKAEAALTLGTPGDPKALMLEGVNGSIARVAAFATAKGQALTGGSAASTDDYIAAVTALYDGAADTDAKMTVLMKEYYLVLWGNGIEAYNMYRRTGKPADMQPMRTLNAGSFLRSFLYPANFVNLNANVTQKPNTSVNKVFWDNNPDNFIR